MKPYFTVPMKVVRNFCYFYLALGFSLLITSLFLSGCNNTTEETSLNWVQAGKVQDAVLLLAAENTNLSSTRIKGAVVADIPIKESSHLYIFNFKSSGLCGQLGCLYAGYLSRPKGMKQVFNFYLQPNVLPGKHLITLNSDDTYQTPGLPCLDVQQVVNNTTLQNLTYCFDGDNYQPVEDNTIKISQSKK